MTYEEITNRVNISKKVSICEIGDIPHGKTLKLSNGGIVNYYNTGKYVIQGKS